MSCFSLCNIRFHAFINLSILFLIADMHSHAQRFAVIGDFGSADENERHVAELVKSWKPDFIITTGDNNYSEGSFESMDSCIGQFYSEYIYPYHGSFKQGNATYNRFFPSLGNHDVTSENLQLYCDYFTLPGNERYYDFVTGQIHFFVLNSNISEPDGTEASSEQGAWLRRNLKKSASRWKIVYFHHPPFSSGYHGSSSYMRWPFDRWGADAVICGHEHSYERLQIGAIPYFVNGCGGACLRSFTDTLDESRVRYCDDFGAQLVDAYQDSMVFCHININDSLIDRYVLIHNPVYNTNVNEFPSSEEPAIYPNPFSQSANIQFSLYHTSDIQIKAYNTVGEMVDVITEQRLSPGSYSIEWKNSRLKPGIYYLIITCNRFARSFRVLKL